VVFARRARNARAVNVALLVVLAGYVRAVVVHCYGSLSRIELLVPRALLLLALAERVAGQMLSSHNTDDDSLKKGKV
jgi:hypothetical protein